MSKTLVSLFLLVVLVCTAVKAGGKVKKEEGFGCMEQFTDREIEKAFYFFDEYLDHVNKNDPRGLEAAKKLITSSRRDIPLTRKAAEIYVYLNEFEQCEDKVIRCINDALRGRRYAEPGSAAYARGGVMRKKTTFEVLLESTLVQAGEKCQSFAEPWFRKAEEKLNANTKSLLHEYMSQADIANRTVCVECKLVDDTLKDENLSKQVSVMDDDQLVGFFRDRVNENLVKPCKDYVSVMSPYAGLILEIGYAYKITNGYHGVPLFFPRGDIADDVTRFVVCLQAKPAKVNSYAKEAAILYKKRMTAEQV